MPTGKVRRLALSRRLTAGAPARRLGLAAVDGAVWVLALLLGVIFRYDFGFATSSDARLVLFLVLAALIQCGFGFAFGLYNGGWRLGSYDEAYAIVLTVGCTTVTVGVTNFVVGRPAPMSAVLMGGALALLGIAGIRWMIRLRRQRRHGGTGNEEVTRVIVFGAGDGGSEVIASMRRDRSSTYLPVALLDDDPNKARLRISGVPVLGRRDALAAVAAQTDAEMLLIAIPSADAELIREINDRANEIGLTVRLLPPITELFDRVVSLSDIRPVSYVDLLGRREVDIDVESISGYLTGRRILVTGAGGSIGSELCRQLRRFSPSAMIMLDRDESALHAVQLSLDGRAMLDDRNLVVADIRDRERLAAVMCEHRPEVVFHTAALKHLPLLEMHPEEAVKTNVWGTWNVLEAAAAVNVGLFVNISTDKAAEPISILGYSKRVAERLTTWFNTQHLGSYVSVRFGNVLGSRGSVLTTFQSQVQNHETLTVTDPDVTRYFMTIEEAVRLVFQAGAAGRGGEVLVLDMGDPVKIADVAQLLIDSSGSTSSITYTGLRPGEKLHEVLLAEDEPDVRPVHPYISHVPVPPLSPAAVLDLLDHVGDSSVAQALADAARAPIRLPEPRQSSEPNDVKAANGKSNRRFSDPLPAPMNEPIYLSPPHLGALEKELLVRAFESNWVAGAGPCIAAFEDELAATIGARRAVALSSGTAALHLALLAAGIGPQDVVLVPSLTFAASANVVRYVGATPVFVDCSPDTWTISTDLVREEIERRSVTSAPVSAIMPVDLFGQCADYDELLGICEAHGVLLIEDAAEALGSTYRGRRAGVFGAAGVISFNGNKILTTGGGGALVTDDDHVADQVRYLAMQARDPVPHYEHRAIGHNYRLSNLLAAIGQGQLTRLDERVEARRSIFARYREGLEANPGIQMMPQAGYGTSNCWLSCILIEPATFGATPGDVRKALATQEIEARPIWKPMHLQPVHEGVDMVGGPVCEDIYARGLCLPSGSALTVSQQDRVIETILSLSMRRRSGSDGQRLLPAHQP